MKLLHPFSLLIDYLESRIWYKCFWDADTFRGLIVLEDGCHDARKCECRTIECVAELHFLVSIAVATFESVCLIGVEVADRTDFKPTTLCLAVNLEVVADS